MDDLVGKHLGPFQIVAPIGAGGMARVYKALQPSVGRNVAVKVLPRVYAEDESFVRRFQHEARMIANLEHPNILPVYDYGQSDGHMWIAMRLVESGTLGNLLHGQPLLLDRIRKVTLQLCDALDFAHARGVIHRDLKPNNVLIDERGNCLLADFGIAKDLESTVQFTNPGAVVGTATYMSPEQGMGHDIDARSDLYALGVILYEMATGRTPFDGGTPLATLMQHINTPLAPPRSLNPALPRALGDVIEKALAKRPDDRFASALAFAAAVRGALPETTEQHTAPPPIVDPGATMVGASLGSAGSLSPTPAQVHPASPPPEDAGTGYGPAMPVREPVRQRTRAQTSAPEPEPVERRGSNISWLVAVVGLLGVVVCLGLLAGGAYVFNQVNQQTLPSSFSQTLTAEANRTPAGTALPGVTPAPVTPGTVVAVVTTAAAPTLAPSEPPPATTPAPPATTAAPPTAIVPPPLVTRPVSQGYFEAPSVSGIVLDGQLDDWPGAWQPVSHITYGAGNWSGEGDLSGSFQVGWSADGLYLAVQRTDDTYSAAPPGDQVYRGDSIEYLFDRLLPEDFNTEAADADDYQVGVGPDAGLTTLNAFRWLPNSLYNIVTVQGAAVSTPSGYAMELLVPWSVFQMDGASIALDRAYGFTFSLNDNDGAVPAQQTLLSTSPARSTINRPMQWGTLVLLP